MAPSITADNNSSTYDYYDEPEYIRVQLVKTKTIPTSKPKKELDISRTLQASMTSSLSSDKILSCTQYSIPGVHSAKILMKDDIDIDTCNLGVSKITREEHPPSMHLYLV